MYGCVVGGGSLCMGIHVPCCVVSSSLRLRDACAGLASCVRRCCVMRAQALRCHVCAG